MLNTDGTHQGNMTSLQSDRLASESRDSGYTSLEGSSSTPAPQVSDAQRQSSSPSRKRNRSSVAEDDEIEFVAEKTPSKLKKQKTAPVDAKTVLALPPEERREYYQSWLRLHGMTGVRSMLTVPKFGSQTGITDVDIKIEPVFESSASKEGMLDLPRLHPQIAQELAQTMQDASIWRLNHWSASEKDTNELQRPKNDPANAKRSRAKLAFIQWMADNINNYKLSTGIEVSFGVSFKGNFLKEMLTITKYAARNGFTLKGDSARHWPFRTSRDRPEQEECPRVATTAGEQASITGRIRKNVPGGVEEMLHTVATYHVEFADRDVRKKGTVEAEDQQLNWTMDLGWGEQWMWLDPVVAAEQFRGRGQRQVQKT